ncbi:MAG: type I 3-dehydroquinate dehydratase [Bacteroidales bacterium]|jgi:3-phosphoshikimate 1-carboxyvinyltransferase|nr:type I 3-dehydroquinate dehydratase [Bacteroidales bacterium]MCI1784730.1 type I 3-dehydroquinate dehydratase [Bacteroidales bacterium]
MICVSIQNKNLREILDIFGTSGRKIEMAEIRLDRCPLSEEDIEVLFSDIDIPLIATCRISELAVSCGCDLSVAAKKAEKMLAKAIEAGAMYVDLEIEAPAPVGKSIRRLSSNCGTILIRSFHDFEGTGSSGELREMIRRCEKFGADLVKIVTTANNQDDAARVMSLYEDSEPGKLLAFCMGGEGRNTRLDCLGKGAPYTYASLTEAEAAAPGQMPFDHMYGVLYGDRRPARLAEPLPVPASKSFAQRAIIAAALADGVSHLAGYSPCGDNEAAIAVAESIGAEVSRKDSVLTIKGIGWSDSGKVPLSLKELNTGESGLLTRLMIPILSVINANPVVVKGVKTLVNRPLSGASDIMASFGVVLRDTDRDSSNGNGDCHIPLAVNGRLIPGRADISGRNGSQLISGLLMSLPLCGKDSVIYVRDPKSIPYMFITLDVLKKFGISISNEMEGGEDFLKTGDWSLCSQITFKIKGGQRYSSADFSIEGDWSSAAAFLTAGALFGSADLSGLDTKSLQADLSIVDILVDAGASISQSDEPEGIIHVRRAPLYAFSVNADNCPDLFPIISVFAAFCQGTSRIGGVGRLANKESDRAKAITDMLERMGVAVHVEGDEMVIEGHSLEQRLLSGTLLKGGRFTSSHDHRMVMALKVAELGADGPVEIDDIACVAKSFPSFMDMFATFTENNRINI